MQSCSGGPHPTSQDNSSTREHKLKEGSIFIFCDTSDAGPDQASRRRQMKAAVADLQCLYYLDANCLHQLHLIVREDLQLIDSFLKGLHEAHPDVAAGFHAYAANLAKCCNFWRSHVAEFIDAWERIHGFGKITSRTDPDPVRYRRFPLAVITGRWGSIENCEAFFWKGPGLWWNLCFCLF